MTGKSISKTLCTCICEREWSYLVSLEYLASHNPLSRQALQPGQGLLAALSGPPVLESLGEEGHIHKSNTGSLKPLGEADLPGLQLPSGWDRSGCFLGEDHLSVKQRMHVALDSTFKFSGFSSALPKRAQLCFLSLILSSK